jgi:hypothetical protein
MPRLQLLRHATLLVDLADVRLLVDPMLSEPGDIPPIPNSPNDRESPLVAMPSVDLDHDAVLVTHRHRDHFDDAARERLPDDVPLYCQPVDADAFRDEGFTDVPPVEDEATFRDLDLYRTPARHGHGELAEQMAPVSGFVLDGDQRLYDSVYPKGFNGTPPDWSGETLSADGPADTPVNAWDKHYEGDPITMDADDVAAVRAHVDDGVPVIADHMDAINHCLLILSDRNFHNRRVSRTDLATEFRPERPTGVHVILSGSITREDLRAAVDGVTIPADGETVEF